MIMDSAPKKELTPEEQKALSNKRVFFGIVGLDVVLVAIVFWAVIELFLA